jgi:hypothetical protein
MGEYKRLPPKVLYDCMLTVISKILLFLQGFD